MFCDMCYSNGDHPPFLLGEYAPPPPLAPSRFETYDFFFTSLRIRAHSRPSGSGDLNDSRRFIHAHCLPGRRGVTDVKDAAFRNSCREKEEKEKESVAISWVHGCIVDAQPPIRNYSQILKSNMAVSSCQSGIAHTNPKSRFTVSGRPRAVRSTNERGWHG